MKSMQKKSKFITCHVKCGRRVPLQVLFFSHLEEGDSEKE